MTPGDLIAIKYTLATLIYLTSQILLCDSNSSTSDNDGITLAIENPSGSPSTASFPSGSTFESLQNDQLCPDITKDNPNLMDPKFRTITINLPKNRISQAYPNKNHDVPCNFNVKASNNKMFNVGIRGIYLSQIPWNFEASDSCSSFIKFRITQPLSTLNQENMEEKEPEVICKIWKTLQHSTLVHPILWNFHSKIGISFQPSIANKSYLQIVFTASSRSTCSIRVQQYLILPKTDQDMCLNLTATKLPPKFRFCGFYRCSDHVHLMSQLGTWTYINWGMNNEYENNLSRDSYWSPLSDSRFMRRRQYWFTAIVRTSIVPILFFGMVFLGYKFFCVLYPSYPVLSERRARHSSAVINRFNDVPIDATNLRASLAPRRHAHSMRNFPDTAVSSTTQSSNAVTGGGGECLEARTNLLPDIYNQPPPDYDDLYLPSYSEATKV